MRYPNTSAVRRRGTTAAGELVFHAVAEPDPNAMTSVETRVRQRMLQSFTRRGLCLPMTRVRWGRGNTAAASRSTPRCESKPLTAPDESAFCAIAPGHRHFGVLAPNSPLRSAVTALAPIASARGPPLWQVAGDSPAVAYVCKGLWLEVHQTTVSDGDPKRSLMRQPTTGDASTRTEGRLRRDGVAGQ